MSEFIRRMLSKREPSPEPRRQVLAKATGIDALQEVGPIGEAMRALLEAAMNYEPADGGIREVGQTLKFELSGVTVEPLTEKGGEPCGNAIKLGKYEIIVRRTE